MMYTSQMLLLAVMHLRQQEAANPAPDRTAFVQHAVGPEARRPQAPVTHRATIALAPNESVPPGNSH